MTDREYKCACGAEFNSQEELNRHREHCNA
jgi:hypothetical protein